ncbi:hypothetical protein, partial [[Phormidium] sp. LEGE 05292]|uniref:hypothetical protein n=1 Tax=[Phormidium] sp. LEGE 05292 TaxID=767427 RepID=UPI0018807ACC
MNALIGRGALLLLTLLAVHPAIAAEPPSTKQQSHCDSQQGQKENRLKIETGEKLIGRIVSIVGDIATIKAENGQFEDVRLDMVDAAVLPLRPGTLVEATRLQCGYEVRLYRPPIAVTP